MKTVYVGGPIAGMTLQEATEWRIEVCNKLADHDIGARFPVLNAVKPTEVYNTQGYDTSALVKPRGIIMNDRWCVQNSDLILMNLLNSKRVSIGSMVEYGWADAYRKPIVTVMKLDGNNPHDHAFVKELSGFIVEDLEEAVHVILGVLHVGIRHPVMSRTI